MTNTTDPVRAQDYVAVPRAFLEQVYAMAREGCEAPAVAYRWCERIDELFHGGSLDEHEEWARQLPDALASAPPSASVGVDLWANVPKEYAGPWHYDYDESRRVYMVLASNRSSIAETEDPEVADAICRAHNCALSQQPAAPSAPVGVEVMELIANMAAYLRAEGGGNASPLVAHAYRLLAQQPAAPSGCPRGLGDSCCCNPAECGQPAAPSGEAVAFANGRLEGLAIAGSECDRLTTALDYAGKEYRRPASAEQCANALRSIYAKFYRELHPDPQKLNELSGNSGQLPALAAQQQEVPRG